MKPAEKVLILITLITMALWSVVNPATAAPYIGGSINNRYVLDLDQEETYDAESWLDLELETTLGPADLFLNPIVSYNYEDSEGDIELKEGYLDLFLPKMDLRLGKQRVTWGKADGLVITNRVSPRDNTRYPAVEFEDQFQSVTGVKASYFIGSDILDIMVIPEFEEEKVDRDLYQQRLKEQFGDFRLDKSEKDIATNLKNSEIALKYSSLGADFDYELVAGYLWDDTPALHLDPAQSTPDNRVFKPQHHRYTMVGGSLSRANGPFVFKGEGVYLHGRYFNIKDPAYTDRTVEKNEVQLMGGVDYYLGDYLLALQVKQEMILDYDSAISKDENYGVYTLMVQRDFLRQTLNTEVTFYYDPQLDQLTARPRLSYDYSDTINLKAGANLALEGEARDDVLYLETEYLF